MRRFLCLFLIISFSFKGFTQKLEVDSVIDKGIYQSFFNFKLKDPLYVTYTLHKGGGPCDRGDEHMSFKQDNCDRCAKTGDYTNSGYEKGHLANAEDFAFDCEKEELTFRCYNCVPQTFELNHGSWLQWEDKIRELSKQEKIFIIAGSIFGKKKMGAGKVGVPSACYKIVLSAKTKKIRYCMIFPNNESKSGRPITLAALKKKMNYDLMPASYWKALGK